MGITHSLKRHYWNRSILAKYHMKRYENSNHQVTYPRYLCRDSLITVYEMVNMRWHKLEKEGNFVRASSCMGSVEWDEVIFSVQKGHYMGRNRQSCREWQSPTAALLLASLTLCFTLLISPTPTAPCHCCSILSPLR